MENQAPKTLLTDSNNEDDRLSKLPERILHRILCSLSQKEAIQTCVLSKAWRYLGCTRPKIEFFCEETLLPGFLSVLDRLLQVYHDRNLPLKRFDVWTSDDNVDVVEASLLLNKWIPIIMQNMGVESFHLYFNFRRQSARIELPSSCMFASDHLRDLSLAGCTLKSSTTTEVRVDLKRLQTLSLCDVYIPEHMLDGILSNCPSVEFVSLMGCMGFTTIKLSNNKHANLKRFSFTGDLYDPKDHDIRDVSIEIGDDMQTLRTIEINRGLLSLSHNKTLEFARLTKLSLRRVQLSSESLSCNLHRLKELNLDQCSGIKEFKLSSRSMKRLDINNINRTFKVTVDAPSMVSFIYEGILPQSISFAGAITSDDSKSKITLGSSCDHEPSHNFNELYGLLKPFSQSEISLELDQIEIRRFGRQLNIRVSPLDSSSTNDHIVGVSEAKRLPVAVEHLRIKMSEKNMHPSAAPFLNRLFQMFRPTFIYMSIEKYINSKSEHREIAELLFKEKETEQSYFWQGVLEGVSLQVLYRNQSEWNQSEWLPVEYTSYTELSRRAEDRELELRIQLKWRE